MSSGGRKRSGSTGGTAKKAKSPGRRDTGAVKNARQSKYKANYAKTVYMPITGIPGSIGPQRIKTRLIYCAGPFQVGVTGGVTSSPVTFALNNAYDPEVAVGGNQPYGFDNFQALGYRQWIVKACKVVCISCPRGPIGAAIGNHAVSLQPVTNATSSALTFPKAVMRGYPAKVIPYQVEATGANGCDTPQGGSKDAYLKRFFRIKDVLGRPLDEDQDAGLFTGGPAQTCNVSVCADCTPAGAVNYSFYIKLVYYIEFFQPVAVADS